MADCSLKTISRNRKATFALINTERYKTTAFLFHATLASVNFSNHSSRL